MKENIDSKFLLNSMKEARKKFSQEDLAYLFATGKNELVIRDLLATELHHKLELLGDEYVAREWHRHDLAVVKSEKPILLIEGKSWIHYDAANPVKLSEGKGTIREGLVLDIRKIRTTFKSKIDKKGFITVLLFTVGIDQNSENLIRKSEVTYGNYHAQGIKKFGSMDALVEKGNQNLISLLSKYGNVIHEKIVDSNYRNIPVRADFFVFELDLLNFGRSDHPFVQRKLGL